VNPGESLPARSQRTVKIDRALTVEFVFVETTRKVNHTDELARVSIIRKKERPWTFELRVPWVRRLHSGDDSSKGGGTMKAASTLFPLCSFHATSDLREVSTMGSDTSGRDKLWNSRLRLLGFRSPMGSVISRTLAL
jgi:hypothetical protein